MSLRLRNTWEYKGDEWWEWAAYIDDDGTGELSKVEFVEYKLHETFPEPIRRVDARKGGFRLDSEGWGSFNLKAFVHFKDGRKSKLQHEIKLEYTPKTGTSN